MNLKQFQLFSQSQTEDEVNALVNQVTAAYQDAANAIQAELNSLYVTVLDTVDPVKYYETMLKVGRLESLLDFSQSQFSYYSNIANESLENASRLSMSNTWYRQQYTYSWLDQNYSLALLDPRIIELSVLGTPESWSNITDSLLAKSLEWPDYAPQYGSLSELLLSNQTEQLAKIQQVITSGLIQGKSISALGKDIQEIMDNFTYQADRIARTETARTMNLAHQLASIEAEGKGLRIMRMWSAAKDSRTRPTHAAMDGKLAPPDGPFPNGVMRPGAWPQVKDNVNERCTTVDVLVDSNGNIDRPKFMRGRNPATGENEIYSYTDFTDWADSVNLKQNDYGEMYI